MKSNEEVKANILRGVSYKIKKREIKIVIVSIIVSLLIVSILYFLFFAKKIPIEVTRFKNVSIERSNATINQLDSRELPYNNLIFSIDLTLFNVEREFYVENNDSDNTSTLYFYMSQNYIQQIRNKKIREEITTEENLIETHMLLYPKLCHTDKIHEITKVYYLIYDYKNLKQEEFNKAKSEAVLLWEK